MAAILPINNIDRQLNDIANILYIEDSDLRKNGCLLNPEKAHAPKYGVYFEFNEDEVSTFLKREINNLPLNENKIYWFIIRKPTSSMVKGFCTLKNKVSSLFNSSRKNRGISSHKLFTDRLYIYKDSKFHEYKIASIDNHGEKQLVITNGYDRIPLIVMINHNKPKIFTLLSNIQLPQKINNIQYKMNIGGYTLTYHKKHTRCHKKQTCRRRKH